MEGRPTPASFAKLQAERARRYAPGRGIANLREHYPELLEELARFGLEPVASTDEWEDKVGAESVGMITDPETSAFEIAAQVRDAVANRDLPLLAYLTVETLISRNSDSIAGYLRSAGTSLQFLLGQLAERLGRAFLDAAFLVTWQRPAVFRRTLESARAYLEWTVAADTLEGREPSRGIRTRIGLASVLAARFGPIAEQDLRHAREMLLESHHQGSHSAFENYIEASVWLYDLYGDTDSIRDAAQRLVATTGTDAGGSIMAAHLWMRLAGIASTPAGVAGFIERGRAIVTGYRWVTNKHEDAALSLLGALFNQLESELLAGGTDLSTRGVLFPFGHRRPDTPIARVFSRSLPRLIGALVESEHAGDFVFRDLIATFNSLYARDPGTSSEDAVRALRSAIGMRDGSYMPRARPLKRLGVEVDQAADRFLLASLTGSSEMRRLGFVELVRASGPDDLRPRYLTMIAKEVEERGPLAGGFVSAPEDLALAIRNGDSGALFEAAARAAYSSADLTQVLLGGRGGVVTLRDSDGIAGQTFVYKRTREEAKLRDEVCSEAVNLELSRRSLFDRFGVIEHLTDIRSLSVGTGVPGEIVSVRRFTDGVPLLNHLRDVELESIDESLGDVAEFLSLIHFVELHRISTEGTRADLRERELGRWLRALRPTDEERKHYFQRWWGTVEQAPLLPRRDAHPLNWIVSSDKRVLAVDLESKGARPFGYELAQLVEDGQVLPANEYDRRAPIIGRYLDSWNELTGAQIDQATARSWYDAGVLARAVRALSQPNATRSELAHGGVLLESLALRASGDTQVLASELSARWRKLTGRVGQSESAALSEGGRRRISRAMSHHLRHDANLPTNRSGWVHVDELSEVLRASGHRVSSDQLLHIAGALGEPRFELDGEDIRAAYGHSIRTTIAYETRRPPRSLFHATPTRNLASIFEARAGLKPGARNWVHLTESCAVAVDASRRQQAAVAVLEIDPEGVEGLVHASGSTWLAPVVPVSALRIVALRRVKELTRDQADGLGPSS